MQDQGECAQLDALSEIFESYDGVRPWTTSRSLPVSTCVGEANIGQSNTEAENAEAGELHETTCCVKLGLIGFSGCGSLKTRQKLSKNKAGIWILLR
mmetsp:Transcript_62/g.103  ORF Transcript_62/g.103 Transcript_62/m.103 type:complete len:97 (+) Transcript_62:2-292(+)